MRKACKVCGSLNRSPHHRMSCLKGTKFIRIVNKSCARQLRLPPPFARKVGEFLKDDAILYGDGGETWRVQVMHQNGGCTFGNGWKVFYDKLNVPKGAVLLFKYLGYSGFKVDLFDGRTGITPVRCSASGSTSNRKGYSGDASAKGCVSEGNAARRRIGRPPNAYEYAQDVRDVKLYGKNLRLFAIYNLKGELRCRGLPVHGCNPQLVERLGRYIMECGEEVDEPEVKIEPVWPWDP